MSKSSAIAPQARALLWLLAAAAAAFGAAVTRWLGRASLLIWMGVALLLAAVLFPGVVAGTLMFLVVLQDWLTTRGLTALQYADEALLLAALGGLGLRALATRSRFRAPLDGPILLFAACAAVSAIANRVSPWIAVLGLLAVWKGPLAYALYVRSTSRPDQVERWTRVLLVLLLALAAVGVAQRLGGATLFEFTGRTGYFREWQGAKAPSLFLNHNALGHVCVLAGLLVVGLAFEVPSRPRLLYVLAGTASLAGLVVSASRESWLAAGLALGVGAAVTRSRRLLVVALLVGATIAAGAAAVYFGSPVLRAEIARRGAGVIEGWRLYRMGFDDWAYRGEYRVYVILKSWRVFLDHPWLGTGPGRFGGQVALVYRSPLYEQYAFLPLRGEYHPLDVFWSRLLAEFGLVGAFAYAWALLGAAHGALRARSSSSPFVRGLATGSVMAVSAALVLALFAPSFEDPLVAIPVWGWAGLAAALAAQPIRQAAGVVAPP